VGHKISPISYRLGKFTDWQSKWFAKRDYRQLLLEDLAIKDFIIKKLAHCYVSKVDIKRGKNIVEVTIRTARPGMVIGRSGAGINTLKEELTKLVRKSGLKDLNLNIEEIKEPNLDAYLVAYNIAQQIEKRISYRRAMKQAIDRTMQAGAKGIKITCKGRLAGVEIARSETLSAGVMPLSTLNTNIDFGQIFAKTTYGIIGVKVWINKG
jgi:small subunit ribosomal protein S3